MEVNFFMKKKGKFKNELEDEIDPKEAIALFRLHIISPMLDAPRGKIDATTKKLAKKSFMMC